MTCASAREAAAVGLLTGQDPGPEVAEHLRTCSECRAEVDGLRPVPDLLAAAREEGLLDEVLDHGPHVPNPDDALLQRLLAAAAQERAARRSRTLRTLVAVAAALLLVVPAGLWLVARERSPASGVVQATASSAANGVWADVRLTPTDWGSDVHVSVRGVPEGTRCTLVVVTSDGTRQTAATWWVSYEGTATLDGSVAAGTSAIDRVDVMDDGSGTVLLAVPVTT